MSNGQEGQWAGLGWAWPSRLRERRAASTGRVRSRKESYSSREVGAAPSRLMAANSADLQGQGTILGGQSREALSSARFGNA